MLVVWRYKISEVFAVVGGDIVVGEHLRGYRGGKRVPSGMSIYRPSKRKYDYVDYTGKFKGREVEACDVTCFLEVLGYIRFIEVEDGKSRIAE